MHTGGAVDPTKLRDALMKMQKEKMDMQKRFNDIVMENKELREKELRYGPRFGEIEKAGENLVKVRNELGEVSECAREHTFRIRCS
jgi:predicted nuclease with TOPRIM domain